MLLGRSLFRSAMVPALLVEGFVLLNPSFVNPVLLRGLPEPVRDGLPRPLPGVHGAIRPGLPFPDAPLPLLARDNGGCPLPQSGRSHPAFARTGAPSCCSCSPRRPDAPTAVPRSWGGAARLGVFALGVGGFYLRDPIPRDFAPGVPPDERVRLREERVGEHRSLLVTAVHPPYSPTVDSAYQVLVGISVFAVLVLIGLRILAPRRLTLGVLVAMIGILTVCGLALVGWQFSIVTDYVRFGYFLVLPVMLAIGVAVDRLLTLFTTPRATALVARRARSGRAQPGRCGPSGRLAPVALVGILGFLVLLLVTATYTAPVVNRAEQNGTDVGHDQTFLDALTSVRSSSVPGSVLTDPGAVKWTRAILDRNAYAPFIPGHYSFDTTHIADGELAYFGLTDRYAVTNSLVAASIMGTDAQFRNESGTYQASYFGLFQPLFQISINVVRGPRRQWLPPRSPERSPRSPVIELPPAGSSWVSLVFSLPHYRFTETVTLALQLPLRPQLTRPEADAAGSALASIARRAMCRWSDHGVWTPQHRWGQDPVLFGSRRST